MNSAHGAGPHAGEWTYRAPVLRWLVSRGWRGWALLAILVIGFDVAAAALGGETMTNSVGRWFRQPSTAWIVVPLVLYLVAHLTVMPLRYDPLDRSYAFLRKRVNHPTAPAPAREPVNSGHGNG